jgi:hypothetical protein
VRGQREHARKCSGAHSKRELMLYVNHVEHWFSSGHNGQQGIKGINNGQSLLSIARRDEQDRKAGLVGERTCFWRSLHFSLKAVTPMSLSDPA